RMEWGTRRFVPARQLRDRLHGRPALRHVGACLPARCCVDASLLRLIWIKKKLDAGSEDMLATPTSSSAAHCARLPLGGPYEDMEGRLRGRNRNPVRRVSFPSGDGHTARR